MTHLTPVVCYGFPDIIETPVPEEGISILNIDAEPSTPPEEFPVEAPPEGEIYYSVERILRLVYTQLGSFEGLRKFKIWRDSVPEEEEPEGISLYFGTRADYGEPLQTPDTADKPVPMGVPSEANITISNSLNGVITDLGTGTDYICLQLRVVSPAIPEGSFNIYISWEELY